MEIKIKVSTKTQVLEFIIDNASEDLRRKILMLTEQHDAEMKEFNIVNPEA